MAPRKARLVANLIKGLSVSEAEAQLVLMSRRAAKPVLKLLHSAVANAKNKQLNEGKLIIASIRVDQGSMLKRFMPRAQGRATMIQKKMSHITMVLAESEKDIKQRFTIIKKEKKSIRRAKSKKVKPKTTEPKPTLKEDKKGVGDGGFIRRIFRRKSV